LSSGQTTRAAHSVRKRPGAIRQGAVILPIVVMVLTRPALAIAVVLERMLFIDEERLKNKKYGIFRSLQRRKSCYRASPAIVEEIR
jgi:hypothetical protein